MTVAVAVVHGETCTLIGEEINHDYIPNRFIHRFIPRRYAHGYRTDGEG